MNENVSFEIKNDALATIQSLNIEANFDEMSAALTEMLRPYKSMVVTDMTAAKNARAYCNKVKKSIDDSRKMVKKLYNEPYLLFEQKCKALTAICDDAAGAIDAQIKSIEQEERDARISSLRTYFDSSCKDVADYITWERIYNPKWENKSYGVSTAQDDIDHAIDTTRQNIEAVKAMHSPFETTLLLVLQETGDIVKVIQKKAACEALEAQRAAKEQYRAQEAPQKAAESHEALTHAETPPPTANAESGEKTYVFTLEFEATKAQAFMIDDFFKANNIKYRKVR